MTSTVAARPLARPWALPSAIALLAVAALVFPGLSRPAPDTSWLLHVAAQVLEGERLYVDVVEANPPLIVWLNLLPVMVGERLGIPPHAVYHAIVLVLALGSISVTHLLIGRTIGHPATGRYLTLLVAFVLLPLVRADFGEREHLALIMVMPYLLLTALRAEGGAVPRWSAAAIGVVAAVGFALKPHFVLPWLALELALGIARRGLLRRPRVESAMVLLVGLLYVGAVGLFAREYFTLAPLMAGPYHRFLHNSLAVTALLGDGAAPALAALLGCAVLWRLAVHRNLWLVVAAGCAGFYLGAVLQAKGWSYHFYPSLALSVLLFGLMALDRHRSAPRRAQRAFAAVALAVILALPAAVALDCVRRMLLPFDPRYDHDPDLVRLLPLVREVAAGGKVMVLSWSPISTFPLVPEAGATSVSRFMSLWMLGGLYDERLRAPGPLTYRPRAEMGRLERYLNDAVVEDLAGERPELLLVLTPAPDSPVWGPRRLDLLEYFGRDRRFSQEFARYRHLADVGQYWAFERLPEAAPDQIHPERERNPMDAETPS